MSSAWAKLSQGPSLSRGVWIRDCAQERDLGSIHVNKWYEALQGGEITQGCIPKPRVREHLDIKG